MARRSPISRLFRRLLLLACLGVAGTAAFQFFTWPKVESLASQRPETTAFMEHYRIQQKARDLDPRIQWRWVPYSSISPHLKKAVLVSEDINFFDHRGFAEDEIKNAIKTAIERRSFPRGASTLTQQLAKNLWLSPSKNPWRKFKEAWLTRDLERNLEKKRIFEIYLNVVELGPGLFGVEAASTAYFSKSSSQLTPEESALLAASLPRPRSWNPNSSSTHYHRRVQSVLRRMQKATWLDQVI